MTFDLYHYRLLPIFLVSLVIILACNEIWRRFGLRDAGKAGHNVATLESAILGLLALLIGFTFAMALSLFEVRRDAVLTEANAIGTTALRARLLPVPHNAQVVGLLREYVQIRLDITRQAFPEPGLDAAVARSNAIQEALWQQAKAVGIKDNAMVPTGLFVQALNEMIDDQEKRLSALRNRVPNIVLLALYAMAAIAAAFTGYTSSLEARRARLPIYVIGTVVAAVILLIQDLDRPGVGFITVSQQPMINTANSIAGFPD